MKRPDLSEHHLKMHVFAGDWEGEDTVYPGFFAKEEMTANSIAQNMLAFGGFGVIHDYIQTQPDGSRHHIHGVIQFSDMTGDYHMDLYTWLGRRSFTGRLRDNAFSFTQRGPNGQLRITYDFSEADVCKFEFDQAKEGEDFVPSVRGLYHRKGA